MSDLDPVVVGEPPWTLEKDGHTAEARVRAIPDYVAPTAFPTTLRDVHVS